MVQESTDLKTWRLTDLPAQVVQGMDGVDEISLTMPRHEPGPATPAARYFRIRFVVPDPVAAD